MTQLYYNSIFHLLKILNAYQYSCVFSDINSMFKKAPWLGPKLPSCVVVPLTILGLTFVTMSLSNPYVLVTTNPHPFSNALLHKAAVPVKIKKKIDVKRKK